MGTWIKKYSSVNDIDTSLTYDCPLIINISSATESSTTFVYWGCDGDTCKLSISDGKVIPERVGRINYKIEYKTKDKSLIWPWCSSFSGVCSIGNGEDDFGANIISNSVDEEGNGVILFDGNLTELSDYSFAYGYCIGAEVLTNIYLPDSITYLGEYCFNGCSSLLHIETPQSCTTIGDYCFYDCGSLQIFRGSKSLDTLGLNIFGNCPSLNLININKDNTTYITGSTYNAIISNDGKEVLYGCKTTTLPDTIEEIGDYCFQNCEIELNNIIPFSGVTKIGDYAFYNCIGLTGNIDGDDNYSLHLDRITEIGNSAFEGSSNLSYIEIGSGITSVGDYCFKNCTKLKDFKCTSPVGTIPSGGTFMFKNTYKTLKIRVRYDNISGFTAADGWSKYKRQIYSYDRKFEIDYETSDGTKLIPWCDANYQTLKINGGESDFGSKATEINDNNIQFLGTVKSIGENAYNKKYIEANRLTSIELFEGLEEIRDNAFYMCANLSNIKLPNSVESIGIDAFYGCAFSSITLPDSITSLGQGCFIENTKLKSIHLSSGLTEIPNDCFYECSSLSDINLSNLTELTTIGSCAFQDCWGLTSVVIPSSVTEIGSGAFLDCSGLSSIYVNSLVPATIGDDVFGGCNCLIYVPFESVDTYKSEWSDYEDYIVGVSLDNEIYYKSEGNNIIWPYNYLTGELLTVGEGEDIFGANIVSNAACSVGGYYKITFDDTITAIGNESFYAQATSEILTFISLPKTISTIGYNAFSSNKLSEITFSEGLTYVGDNAFDDNNLTSISLPYSLKTLGDFAFLSNSGLSYVQINDTLESIGNTPFGSCPNLLQFNIGNSGVQNKCFTVSGRCLVITSASTNDTLIGFAGKNITDQYYRFPSSISNFSDYVCQNITVSSHYLGITSSGEINIGDYALACGCDIFILSAATPGNAESTCISFDRRILVPYTSLSSYLTKWSTIGSIGFWGQLIDDDWVNYPVEEPWISNIDLEKYPHLYDEEGGMIGYYDDYPEHNTQYYSNITFLYYTASTEHFFDSSNFDCPILYSSYEEVEANTGEVVFAGTLSDIKEGAIYNTTIEEITFKYTISDNTTLTFETGAISGCSLLSSISISNDSESCTNFICNENGIVNCPALETLDYCEAFDGKTIINSNVLQRYAQGNSATTYDIDSEISEIGNYAFRDCVNVDHIEFSSQLQKIGKYCFLNCADLGQSSGITISDSIEIGDGAFSGCSNISFFKFTLSTPCTLGKDALDNGNNCDILVRDECVDTYKAAWSNYANRIKSYGIKTNQILYTSTDGNIVDPMTEYTDFGANIVSNNYSNGQGIITFDSAVTKCNGAFINQGTLKTVELPGKLLNISADDYDFSSFHNCSALTDVILPESLTSVTDYCFNECYNIRSFSGRCSGIYSNNRELIFLGELCGIAQSGKTNFTMSSNAISIREGVFTNNTMLTSITMSDSVSKIGERSFMGCTNLETIKLSNSLISIGENAFRSCSSLTSFTGTNTGITSDNRMFYRNKTILAATPSNTEFYCPYQVTTIIPYVFADSNFARFTSTCYISNVGDYAFMDCTNLSSVTFATGVIGKHSFDGCLNLKKVTFQSVSSVGDYAFYNCSISSADSINRITGSIGNYAFYGGLKSPITTLTLSASTIGDSAFRNCPIQTLNLANRVTSVGDFAFGTKRVSIQNDLKYINISRTNPPSIALSGTEQSSFYFKVGMSVGGTEDPYGVYVPNSTIQTTYRATDGWKSMDIYVTGSSSGNIDTEEPYIPIII